LLSTPAKGTGAADVQAARHDEHRHRLPTETLATETAAKPEPVKTIVTAKPPRKRHYGEIIDDVADPPDYEAATERARQIIQRRLRSPD
jgi:hypothetical protein